MKITKAIITALFILFSVVGQGQQVKYAINGVSKQNGKKIYVTDCITQQHVDSAIVVKGKFSLKGKADKDALMLIEPEGDWFNNWRMPFFNDGKPISVNMNDSTMKSSAINKRLTAYNVEVKGWASKYDILHSVEVVKKLFVEESETIIPAAFIREYKQYFGKAKLDSVLNEKHIYANHPFVKDYLVKLPQLDNLVAKSDKTKKVEQQAVKNSFIGKQFKDFEMGDVDGNMHKLSEYVGNGHWLFVDMWASWCTPCLKEMPNVVAAYEKYHTRGLEIVGLSLDGKKELWVKAIEKHNMPWVHLSDLKGWKSLVAEVYNVNSIPDNLLIDPQGIIVARGLRGEDLFSKLKEIFGE